MSYSFPIFYICVFVHKIIVLQALHHPFTAPNPEDIDDLASARALAYDMVYNGVEVNCFFFFFYSFYFLASANLKLQHLFSPCC
jgi:hypothetical protein